MEDWKNDFKFKSNLINVIKLASGFQDVHTLPLQNGAAPPSASSDISMATVVTATQLTSDDAVKKALKMELDISVSWLQYICTLYSKYLYSCWN